MVTVYVSQVLTLIKILLIELKILNLTLGGPGSGKVGQCESYLSEHPGYVHTNANALFLMNQDQKGTRIFGLKI